MIEEEAHLIINNKKYYHVGCRICLEARSRQLVRSDDGELRLVCHCGYHFTITTDIHVYDKEGRRIS